MTRIGYMGIPFSFTEGMTQSMAAELGIDAEEVPLETARGVVGALRSGEIDLGVLAVRNSTFGPVIETEKALETSFAASPTVSKKSVTSLKEGTVTSNVWGVSGSMKTSLKPPSARRTTSAVMMSFFITIPPVISVRAACEL